jgi:hypothetical protein
MRGAIPPLPQDAFMAWCSVRKASPEANCFDYKSGIKSYFAAETLERIGADFVTGGGGGR